MKDLVICEKPDLAVKLMKGLSSVMQQKFERHDGYFESENYIVTFAFGHLFELFDVEMYRQDYDENTVYPWTMEGIPFVPENHAFQFVLKRKPAKNTDGRTVMKIDSGVKKQFEMIKKLVDREDVNHVINCGDADREGEIIVRLILKEAKNRKTVYRLWVNTQIPYELANGMKFLKKDYEQDHIANEGFARMYIDWLWGINYTRFASLKTRVTLRIGRVISAIVWAIYLRDMEIKNFKPEKYYVVASDEETHGDKVTLKSKHQFQKDEKEQAEELARIYDGLDAVVTDIKKESKAQARPKLFSLTTMQKAMSKAYTFSPDRTLKGVQKIYEKGFVTYPRTGTEYLSESEKGTAKKVIEAYVKAGYDDIEFRDGKSIFDTTKVESHSALIPTYVVPTEAEMASMSDDERKCYEMIRNRFLAVFCKEDYVLDVTTMSIDVGVPSDDIKTGERFELKGKILKELGWKKYDFSDSKDKMLPALKVGDQVVTDFKDVEKLTQPPKHFTESEMLSFLENPFRKEKNMSEDEHYKAMRDGVEIGTEATRSSIIKNAIDAEYIAVNKSTYTILPKGAFMCQTLQSLDIDMSKEKTVELSQVLKKVNRGEMSVDEAIDVAYDEVAQNINKGREKVVQLGNRNAGKEVIGKCPVCGGYVYENKSGYACSRDNCDFILWKNNKYFQAFGIASVTKAMAKALLNKGHMRVKGLRNMKTGKEYDVSFEMSYDRANKQCQFRVVDEVIGVCPVCGRDVIETKGFVVCSGNKKDDQQCNFFLSKDQRFFEQWTGKKITTSQIKTLLKKRRLDIQCLKKDKSGTYPGAVTLVSVEKEGKTYWGLHREQIDFSTLEREVIGYCPKCGAPIYEGEKNFYCSNQECRFALWKEMKHFSNTLKITKAKAKALLSGKGMAAFKLVSKAGKEYEAYLAIKLNGDYVNFEQVGFVNRKKK